MVGLQACAQAAGQANGGTKLRDDADFCGGGDQVLHAHEFAHGCGHLGCEAGGKLGQPLRCGLVGEQPVAELADRERVHGRKGFGIVRIDNQPRYFIALVSDHLLLKKMGKGHIGQGKLRRHALFCGRGSNTCQLIPAAQRRRLGEQFAQAAKCVTNVAYGGGENHGNASSLSEACRRGTVRSLFKMQRPAGCGWP